MADPNKEPLWLGYIESSVKETHEANSEMPAIAEIIIPHNTILGFKSVLFDLKNREICNGIPTLVSLHNIDVIQPRLMRKSRRSACKSQKANRNATLPDMEVTNLSPTTFKYEHTV